MNVHIQLYIIRLYMYDKCFAKVKLTGKFLSRHFSLVCAEGEPHSCKTHNVVYFTVKILVLRISRMPLYRYGIHEVSLCESEEQS